jgi:hypothetical protein
MSDLEVSMMKRVGELNKEVELLKGQVNYWRIEAECDHGRWLRCLEDLEKLRASSFVTAVPSHQYERVIKAGDAMAKRTEFFQKRWDADELCQEVEAWNAAKEGKPSV